MVVEDHYREFSGTSLSNALGFLFDNVVIFCSRFPSLKETPNAEGILTLKANADLAPELQVRRGRIFLARDSWD